VVLVSIEKDFQHGIMVAFSFPTYPWPLIIFLMAQWPFNTTLAWQTMLTILGRELHCLIFCYSHCLLLYLHLTVHNLFVDAMMVTS